jgi:pilus assembly protein Flp/PilA
MISYLKTWLELKTDRRAVTALEYGLIAAVVGGVILAGFTTLGTSINTAIGTVAKTIAVP